MSSFFTTPASQRKRKRPETTTLSTSSNKRRGITSAPPQPSKNKPRTVRDESISSGASESGDEDDARAYLTEEDGEASSGNEDETADERRLRLAQRYLDNIREEVTESGDPYAFDAADVDRDLIAERLREDVKEGKGKLHRFVAGEGGYAFGEAERTFFEADQRGVTGVAVILPYVFTVARNGSICKWELAFPSPSPSPTTTPIQEEDRAERRSNITPRKRPKLLQRFRPPPHPKSSYAGHTGPILCIASSSSGRFLATGGADKRLVIWDPTTLRPLKHFTHHRDAVLAVSFRRGTHTLYSASKDRTCKVWSLDSMGYVQTLFGHQDEVSGIAGCADEKFVSVGARDRTARLFKVVEEQQLVFRGGGGGGSKNKRKDSANGDAEADEEEDTTRYEEGSIDRVALIDEETFITGSDNGSISLWSVLRKKPVFTVPLAHGTDEPLSLQEAYAEEEGEVMEGKERPGRRKPRWITALATIPLADLILTGSWDGHIRVWRVTPDRRRIESVGTMGRPIPSHVLGQSPLTNGDAQLGAKGKKKEHKPVRGVINDITLVERSEKTKTGMSTESSGLCVVAAVGKTHRLGKWDVLRGEAAKGVKNGAVVFEVPRRIILHGVLDVERISSEQMAEM